MPPPQLSLSGIRQGLLHTLVTSFFSHAQLSHLAFNMVTLYFFAPATLALLGARRFAGVYLAGGLVGSACVLLYHWLLPRLNIPAAALRGSRDVPTLGASAAVNAIVMMTVALFPRHTFYLYMVVPVPAALFGAFFIALDLYGAFQGGGDVANAGHLGGAAVGLAYGMMLRRKFRIR